jgi:hypothetical protein
MCRPQNSFIPSPDFVCGIRVYLVAAMSVRKEIPASTGISLWAFVCALVVLFVNREGSIHLAFRNEGKERMRESLSICIQSAAQNLFAWTKEIVMNSFGPEQS